MIFLSCSKVIIMATIKFFLQKEGEDSQIYLRFSNGRNNVFKKKTGFVINSKNWDTEKAFPKNINTAEIKNLKSSLDKIKSYLNEKKINEALEEGEVIDSNWIEKQINECFKRVVLKDKDDKNILLNRLQHIIDNADTKQKGENNIGLSKSTIKNYILFKKVLIEYEKKKKTKILFRNIDIAFTENFKNWLLKDKGYTKNYAGKQIELLKTVCIDALKNNIKVTEHSTKLKSFKESEKDKIIHTLSFAELEQIRNTEMPSETLENVRKWILIGCFIGQRGSDLLNITQDNVRFGQKGLYIDLIQQKTSKNVTVGVLQDYIIEIITKDFPKKISHQRFNKYIKQVCEIAKINEVVMGTLINPETNRRETKKLPKWNFITSHSLRRSFATNFYKKMPTPILIKITGHSKESMFLKYINQGEDKDANADLFMEFFEKMNKDKAPEMKVLKNASNG